MLRRFQLLIIAILGISLGLAGCDSKDSGTEPRDNDSRIRASAFCYTVLATGVKPLSPVAVVIKSDVPYQVAQFQSGLDGWTPETEWLAKLGENGLPLYDSKGRPVPPDRFFVDARYNIFDGVKFEPYSDYLIPFVGYDQAKPKDTLIVFDIELTQAGLGAAHPSDEEIIRALRDQYPTVVWFGRLPQDLSISRMKPAGGGR